jgi:hypothetical protein
VERYKTTEHKQARFCLGRIYLTVGGVNLGGGMNGRAGRGEACRRWIS